MGHLINGTEPSHYSTDSLVNFTMTPEILEMEDYGEFHFYANGIIANTMCGLGVLGNIINIAVFTSQIRHSASSTNLFLLTMAISDLLVLCIYITYAVSCIVLPAAPVLRPADFSENEVGSATYFIYYVWYFPANIFMALSNWLIVSVMVFRFIAVYFPLRASAWCSVGRAKLVISLVSAVSLILFCPEWFTVRIQRVGDGFVFVDTQLFHSESFNRIYYCLVEILNSVLPFLICSVFSGLLIRALRTRKLISHSISKETYYRRRRVEQKRISTMVLVITSWFLLCSLPSFICRITRLLLHPDSPVSARVSWREFRAVADLFLLMNHVANALLYSVFSKVYRRHFKKLFLCQKETDSRSPSSVLTRRITAESAMTCHYTPVETLSE